MKGINFQNDLKKMFDKQRTSSVNMKLEDPDKLTKNIAKIADTSEFKYEKNTYIPAFKEPSEYSSRRDGRISLLTIN